MAKAKAQKKKRSIAGRFVRLFLRLGKGLILAVFLAAVWSAGFIWLKCYSGSASQRAAGAHCGLLQRTAWRRPPSTRSSRQST